MQKGNTCLFECFHYLDSSKTVDEWIELLAPGQNVYEDGYAGSAQDIIIFVHKHFKTVEGPDFFWYHNLVKGCKVITSIPAVGEDGQHSVVLTSVATAYDLSKVRLYYYNPAFGKTDVIPYLDFINTNPKYAIAVCK